MAEVLPQAPDVPCSAFGTNDVFQRNPQGRSTTPRSAALQPVGGYAAEFRLLTSHFTHAADHRGWSGTAPP